MNEKAKRILRLVSKIPKGKVVTYKQVSEFLDIDSPRFVGQVLHGNDQPENVPCHRVVFVNGALAENYAFGGMKAQKKKLEDEGVKFSNDKVDFRKSLYRFVPSDAE